MPLDLYYVPGSAPCRSVMLAAKAIGVDLNLKLLDLMKGEHLTPEFIKVSFIFFFQVINLLSLLHTLSDSCKKLLVSYSR